MALLLENDGPMIASVLGVLKAGKMYVPLDPAFPVSRNAAILADSEARLNSHQQQEFLLSQGIAGHRSCLDQYRRVGTFYLR